MTMYVPLVTVNVHPAPNGDRPAIEKTTRSCQCPPYEVDLIKNVWGSKHAEKVTVDRLPEHVNPMWELVPRDGRGAIETEILRLENKYQRYAPGTKVSVMLTVYRAGDLRAAIEACVTEANAFLDAKKAQAEEDAADGASVAAAALMKASGAAVTRAKAGPGRPRKNPPFKNPEEAPVPAGVNAR